jgi:FKBP-type peptidyl-prolyl cis-trans isomerase
MSLQPKGGTLGVRVFIFVLTLLTLAASTAAAADPVVLDTDDKRALYAWGAMLSFTMRGVEVSPEEFDLIVAGFRDQKLEGKAQIPLEEQQPIVKAFMEARLAESAAREAERSKAFLEEQAAQPGAVTSETGLVYREEKAGSGASPEPTDTVTVHYHGTTADGTVFDSSRERGEPAVFTLQKVIPCWQEAIPRMKVGGQASITCPASIAYGDRGFGAKIPGGAVLHFDVELIEID